MKPHVLQRNNQLTVPAHICQENGWLPGQVHFYAVDIGGGVAFFETNENGEAKDARLFGALVALGMKRREVARGEGDADAETE